MFPNRGILFVCGLLFLGENNGKVAVFLLKKTTTNFAYESQDFSQLCTQIRQKDYSQSVTLFPISFTLLPLHPL